MSLLEEKAVRFKQPNIDNSELQPDTKGMILLVDA